MGPPWLVLAFGQSCPLPDPVAPVAHPQGAVRRAWSAQAELASRCVSPLSVSHCVYQVSCGRVIVPGLGREPEHFTGRRQGNGLGQETNEDDDRLSCGPTLSR